MILIHFHERSTTKRYFHNCNGILCSNKQLTKSTSNQSYKNDSTIKFYEHNFIGDKISHEGMRISCL